MSMEVYIKKNLKDFTLDVEFSSNSEPLAILGASGSGKSMTLKCIAGIETPDEGYILVSGTTLFDSKKKINISPQKRDVGYMFQNYALFPHMTVYKNITCGIKDKALKLEIASNLISKFHLQGLEKKYPSKLSGGQQQRVALARIIAYTPKIFLMDEPFSALDSNLKDKLKLELLELIRNYYGDVLFVSHSRDEVYSLSKQLAVMSKGKVISFGKTNEIFENPQKLETAILTGCKNFSKAVKINSFKIKALDWDIVFNTNTEIPDKVSYLGIRAHDFIPIYENKYEKNLIPIEILKVSEGCFENDIIFKNLEFKEQKELIWWKAKKSDLKDGFPKYLSFNAESLLLLED